MGLFNDIKGIFKKDYKLFLFINALYFGMVILGAIIAIAYPQAQMALLNAAGQTYGADSSNPLSGVGQAYRSGNVLLAAAVTFVTNLFLGTLIEITIPSLIIPFWALLMGIFRALTWGIMLIVPVAGVLPTERAVPHYLTILLEGEAYVVAIFACTRGLLALFKPQPFGTQSRLKAYLAAIVDNGRLMLVVIVLLAIAALYEAWEVMYFAGIIK